MSSVCAGKYLGVLLSTEGQSSSIPRTFSNPKDLYFHLNDQVIKK